jgi:Methyltransferase domain
MEPISIPKRSPGSRRTSRRASVNQADPPLPYPDRAFDLVYNHSVFTHIDERRQDMWLSELQRVTRPGGLVLLSVHGEVAMRDADQSLYDRLASEGIVFQDDVLPKDFPLPDWYQNTLHAPWYIFEHWGLWFDVRAYVTGAALGLQDHVLLERRPDGARPARPIAARPFRPAASAPNSPITSGLAEARGYRSSGIDLPSRYGSLGRLARKVVLRLLRPYSAHEDNFDEAVASSLVELRQVAESHAERLRELEHRLSDGA